MTNQVINPTIIGVVLKEAIFGVINMLETNRLNYETHTKSAYDGEGVDPFTDLDKKAQDIVTKLLIECFPDFGIISEEENYRYKPEAPIYFTIDPIDGTSAFIRNQSNNVGCMIALIDNGKVVASFIGDINTKEIYYFKPESDKVWRIKNQFLSWKEDLAKKTESFVAEKPISKSVVYSQTRESKLETELINVSSLYKNFAIDKGSIGIIFTRLFKGEYSAIILDKYFETPWDTNPIIGMCQKLGYVFLKFDPDQKIWVEYNPTISKEIYNRDFDAIVIHSSKMSELNLLLQSL
ncbi:hypothetical protein HC766_02570 [Candidatus Gracilibacteria bacterium]|nr:hypothetical protein [Candidatus Gracilibacteria bacterium]NJS41243.1 hypothetical protein [Candidatus Gracilibacteria bacterium]